MKFRSSLLCISAAAIVAELPASAALYTTTATRDAFVTGGSANASAGLPDKNYGGAGALMISPAGTTKGEIQTLLKFNLATTKTTLDTTFGAGQWMVNSIKLQLGTNFGSQGAQPNNAIFNAINGGLFKIDWLANDNWIEGTGSPSSATTDGVTFNDLATLENPLADKLVGTFTYTPVGNTNPPTVPAASYIFTLDPSMLADVTAGGDVSFRAYAGDTGVGYLFNSRSFGTVANQPVLILDVVPVPEPGTGAYVGGLLLAGCCRRLRHARRA
jgi:hypothetical protein